MDGLIDLKDKAESEFDVLRNSEGNAKYNFNMLKQSLEDQISAHTTALDQEKSAKATAEETKATAVSDLAITIKHLADACVDDRCKLQWRPMKVIQSIAR